MMQNIEYAWFHDFAREYKSLIIRLWLREVEQKYPDRFNLAELEQNGRDYYRLVTDIADSIESHPLFEAVRRMAAYHSERQTPLPILLESSYIWRRCIVEQIQSYVDRRGISHRDALRATSLLNFRIDSLQQLLSRTYWELADLKMATQQQTIQDLHKDRLNTLGKMAASMAHEIRNPLTSIAGFLKLIRAQLSSPLRIESYLNIIENEFDSLYAHINNFLHFSKGNEEMEEPCAPCALDEIVESVHQLIRPRLIDENVDFQAAIPRRGAAVSLQRKAMQQVLLNLIANSIDALQGARYPKKIEVAIQEDTGSWYIHIKDNGPGIPEDCQDTLFQPFVTTKSHGTGIGLAICNRILAKNGGEIGFASRRGETTFTIRLPKVEEGAAKA